MMQEFDLIQRSRRLRGNPVLRELVRETRVSPSALIYPLFIREGQRVREPIPSLEGQYRYSPDTLLWELETLEKAVDDIESSLQNSLDREVTSMRIGELAMDKLKDIDEVAYVRFASVYRHFRDINAFMDELSALLQNR